MSIEAIRCPGCKDPQTGYANLVNVAELEAHYRSNHKDGIVKDATMITTANPTDNPRFPSPYPTQPIEGPPHSWQGYPPQRPKTNLIDSPIWGPFIRRFFPHLLFGAFTIGIIVGVILW